MVCIVLSFSYFLKTDWLLNTVFRLLAIGLSSHTESQEAITTGVVLSTSPFDDHQMVSNMIAWGGDSGAGLFSRNNKVLGIVTVSQESDEGEMTRTYFAPSNEIRCAWVSMLFKHWWQFCSTNFWWRLARWNRSGAFDAQMNKPVWLIDFINYVLFEFNEAVCIGHDSFRKTLKNRRNLLKAAKFELELEFFSPFQERSQGWKEAGQTLIISTSYSRKCSNFITSQQWMWKASGPEWVSMYH